MYSIAEYLSQIQPPQYHNLPMKLKAGRRHVVWCPEERGDKIGKTPYRARALVQSGKYFKASSTNPQSWSSFPQAVKAAQEYPNVGGIGRVLTDGIMQIDADHVYNRETGELHPAACEIAAMFDTYTELSPSGEGLHIFPLAHLPEGAKNTYHYKGIKIEIYDRDRYSTITGIPVPGLPQISELRSQQAQVEALIERLSSWERENTGVCVCVCGDAAQQGNDQAGQCSCTRDQQPEARTSTLKRKSGQGMKRKSPDPGIHLQTQAPAIREADLPQADLLILERARAARNRETFIDLWQGGDPHHRGDVSRADFDLILLLLYWTGDNEQHDCSSQVERLFRASPRLRPKHASVAARKRYSHLQMSIYNARCRRYGVILPEPEPEPPGGGAGPQPTEPTPEGEARAEERKRGRRSYQVINYVYDWMQKDFDQAGWSAGLYTLATQAKLDTQAHFQSGGRQLQVTALPPGVGKSHAFGELCDDMDLAVIVPRHELILGVPGYKKQRHIVTASEHNCPSHENHHRIAALSYNTRPVHKEHEEPCDFISQYDQTGSAIYQIAHSETSYVGRHEGILIDEWNLPDWLHERTYTIERLRKAAHQFSTEEVGNRYLVAWQSVLAELEERGEGSYQGKVVFDMLDQRLHHHLADLHGVLGRHEYATNEHPWPHDIEDQHLGEVLLPFLFLPMQRELARWQRGEDWNSCLRVTVDSRKNATLHITTTRTINAFSDGARRAIAIADATAHKAILAHWYGSEVEVSRLAQDPPPHTKHYHLAERCSKRSMQAKHGRDQARAIKKLKYFLSKFDPTGEKTASGNVGLITYMGNEETMRQALHIPIGRTGHFWAMRGSNALEECEILLIVGTPTLSPETCYRIARTVYRDDPRPITEGSTRDEQGRPRYLDYRVQELSDYLTNAELTQCGHRHRPLRYDGRILVSICDSDIDYLPVTHFVAQMPRLTEEGEDAALVKKAEDDAKLDQARRELEAQSIPLAVHRLARLAGLATTTAGQYLREWRAAQAEIAENTHTHTHQCSHSSVPDSAMENIISNPRYENGPGTGPAPGVAEMRVGTETSPPKYGKPCARCGHIDAWVRDHIHEMWCCSCYYWWYEHPEWRETGPRRSAG